MTSKYDLKFTFNSVNIHINSHRDLEIKLKELYNNHIDNPYQFMIEIQTIPGIDMIGTELK